MILVLISFLLFFFTQHMITYISSWVLLYCIVILPKDGPKSSPERTHCIGNTWISQKIKIKLYFVYWCFMYDVWIKLVIYSDYLLRICVLMLRIGAVFLSFLYVLHVLVVMYIVLLLFFSCFLIIPTLIGFRFNNYLKTLITFQIWLTFLSHYMFLILLL